MADHIISVDAGNGGVNAIRALKKSHKSVYFPSVRAAATGDTLGLGEQFELQYDYVDWSGHRYVVGDDVIRLGKRNAERHQGAWRYGDEFHQFLVAVAVGQLGVKKGTVDLTLFAPPGMYVEAKEAMQKRFKEHDGYIAIGFKGEKSPRKWQYTSVTVWPEGIGAAACFALDDRGGLVENDTLKGRVVVLDIGMYTLDALRLIDGNFDVNSLEQATIEHGGLKQHLHEPVLRFLKKRDDDFSLATIDTVDMALRRGLNTGDYTLTAGNKQVDMQPLIDKYRERHAEWIANNIIDGMFDSLRDVSKLILVGGGAVLIQEYMRKWYGDKLIDFQASEGTADVHPVNANAVGGIRLAQMRQRQGS